MEDNLKLWDSVKKTDPDFTKSYKGKGGFNGTAICAQWQRWRATELWGPYGDKWKTQDDSYAIVELSDDFHDSILVYKATLIYPTGIVPIVADIDIWTYNRTYKSWAKGNDIHKKVSTDALTKGLSMLGFSADVFMGKYDDNKYVTDLKTEKREEVKKETKKKPTFLEVMVDAQKEVGDEFYFNVLTAYKYDCVKEIKSEDKKKILADLRTQRNKINESQGMRDD